uniref:Riboflavin transporter n=1 Tax=Ascaris lumbricoides TaxID=6252 RepID=A0A0M3HFG5_ASCLU
MAFFWHVTVFIFNQQRSIALIILLFGMALVNSTSNVLFMPYMSTFHPSYLTAYFVGMGLSALFPSLVSIAQGSSDECVLVNDTMIREKIAVRFGVREYNLVMLVWLLLATFSFALLHWSKIASDGIKSTHTSTQLPVDEASPLNVARTGYDEKLIFQRYADMNAEEEKKLKVSKWRYAYLLLLMAIVNAQMNGIIPSIQSYAAIPYSQATYHLGLTLSNVAAPLACFLPLLVQPKGILAMSCFTVLSSLLTAVIVMLAAMSPAPFLHTSIYGKILAVSANTFEIMRWK